MAPELLNDGEENYDQSVDVYAYGVLVYRMFSSSIELDDGYGAKSVQQLMLRILKGARFKRVSEIPECYWHLIERCWQPDPSLRPSFSDIVDCLCQPDLIVPGTNSIEYDSYRSRLLNMTRDRSLADGSTMSGNSAFCSRVSSDCGGAAESQWQRTHRYNFTRSKYRRE